MLSKEALIVLRHYLQQGLSKAAIAERLGVSCRTVQRYVKSGETTPTYGPRPVQPAKLDPYKSYLTTRLAEFPELSGARLLTEIRDRGYTGGYTMLRQFLQVHRSTTPPPFERRYEVEPGQQAQVDFATFRTPFGTVQALLVVLSWSRVLWVRFSLHQDQLTVLSGLHQAFLAFGGVPHSVLFDRMRTAVAGAGPSGAAIFNEEMLRFAAHYGFRPVACRPYRPQTKGRVERAVSYLRQNFFYARSFRDLDDLNAQCAAWLTGTANVRIHGTTGVPPVSRLPEERPRLLPLPVASYIPLMTVGRRISRDGFVSYNGNDYSIPDGVGQREIELYPTLTELRVLVAGQVIARHPLAQDRGQRILDPSHRLPLPTRMENAPAGAASGRGTATAVLEVERRPLDVYERVLQ